MANESQEQILSAAIAAIAEKGIEGLRTRDVARRACVNISTLHYYFGTKERLLLAVLDHVSDALAASFGREGPPLATAREELHAHIVGAFQTFRKNPDFATVLQELRIRSARDSCARKAFRDVHRRWNEVVEQILSRGVRDREMRAAVDPAACAAIVTSFIMGITMQLWINPKSHNATDVVSELERCLFD